MYETIDSQTYVHISLPTEHSRCHENNILHIKIWGIFSRIKHWQFIKSHLKESHNIIRNSNWNFASHWLTTIHWDTFLKRRYLLSVQAMIQSSTVSFNWIVKVACTTMHPYWKKSNKFYPSNTIRFSFFVFRLLLTSLLWNFNQNSIVSHLLKIN